MNQALKELIESHHNIVFFGGAGVSDKHAGFVVNYDNATAAEVHAVIEHVQAEVKRQFDVELYPEVRFLGE